VVYIVGDGGFIGRDEGDGWVCRRFGYERLRDVEAEGKRGYAVGDDGVVYGLQSGGPDRERVSVPTEETLRAVWLGETDVAVRTEGTVIEK